jgi:large subunit ribosomal protein L27
MLFSRLNQVLIGLRKQPITSSLSFILSPIRFATSKAGGSSKNGRDSQPKFLGIKKYGGEFVAPGHIIVRQRGAKIGVVESTKTVGMGRDHTIFALKPGYVKFWFHTAKKKSFVEIVKAPPAMNGGSVQPEDKYPIVRVKSADLPHLYKLEKQYMTDVVDIQNSVNNDDIQQSQSTISSSLSKSSLQMSAEVRKQLQAYSEKLASSKSSGGRGPGFVRRAVLPVLTKN